MTSQFLIYALVDPRSGERFYVGQSSKGLSRPKQHTNRANLKDRCPKAARVREIVAYGLKPAIEVLQYVADPDAVVPAPLRCWSGSDIDALNATEMWWILHGNIAGWPLRNRTDGGEGARGMVVTDEHRANMSKGMRGVKRDPFSDEHRANMSKSMRGKKKSAEHIAKTAAAMRGRKASPEHVAKRVAALTGQKRSKEQRMRISDAVKNSPKAIVQREKLRMSKFGKKHPPRSKETLAKMKALGESRRGVALGHGDKIRATKAKTLVGRHFALLLAGLATIR